MTTVVPDEIIASLLADISDWQARVEELERENMVLVAENRRLRQLVDR